MDRMVELAKYLLWPLAGVALLLSGELRSCLAPFFFGLLLALALRPAIRRLEGRLPRWLAALFMLTLAGLLILCLMMLGLVKLGQALPGLIRRFQGELSLWPALDGVGELLPLGLRGQWAALLELLARESASLLENLAGRLASWGGELLSALPARLFTLGILLLAAYYAAADWPRVRRGLLSLLPVGTRGRAPELLARFRRGAGRWLKAQGKLMGLAVLVLAGGLMALGIEGAIYRALLIALADALPFLGTGLVLLPWAALELLQGAYGRALGLALLWLVCLLLRSVLEPRLLGKAAGVSPLLTLFVMYAGLTFFGLAGLVLGPVALTAGMAVEAEKEM